MTTSHLSTASLTALLDAAHAQGLDSVDELEAALEARVDNSHFCPKCHKVTDGGPCPFNHGATDPITQEPSFGIHR